MFEIDTTGPAAIGVQIEEGMRRMIVLGVLPPGAPVPSVRELAQRLRVNPNTVARAYQKLTEAGVFTARRGEGTFVADEPSQPRKSERAEALRDAANRFAGTALALGATLDEARCELERNYERLTREHRRKA